MAIQHDSDWCDTCQRSVPDETEHDYQAHGSSRKSALELAAWKKSFEQDSELRTARAEEDVKHEE
jgi:hypothetical protein